MYLAWGKLHWIMACSPLNSLQYTYTQHSIYWVYIILYHAFLGSIGGWGDGGGLCGGSKHKTRIRYDLIMDRRLEDQNHKRYVKKDDNVLQRGSTHALNSIYRDMCMCLYGYILPGSFLLHSTLTPSQVTLSHPSSPPLSPS